MKTFGIKPEIKFGEDSLSFLKDLPYKKYFIVTDEMMVQLKLTDKIIDNLNSNCKIKIFSKVLPNPTVDIVQKGIAELITFEPECVIALGGLSFDYLANSLPYPLDSIPRHGWGNKRSQRDAMDLIPFMKEFNQERLQVTNLEKGHYRLTIDGLFIDNVSSGQLEDGINLADYPNTPQYQQAMKIMYLNEERFEVEKRFREYLWTEYSFLKKEGLLFADNEKAINKLREYLPKDGFLRMSYEWYTKAMYPEIREVWSRYMKIIVDTIYKMNKPTTHKVKLTKIG